MMNQTVKTTVKSVWKAGEMILIGLMIMSAPRNTILFVKKYNLYNKSVYVYITYSVKTFAGHTFGWLFDSSLLFDGALHYNIYYNTADLYCKERTIHLNIVGYQLQRHL